jgi:hypothetical protein
MEPFGYRSESPLSHNEAAAVVLVGFNQVRFEVETFDERERRGFFRNEGVRTAFEEKAIALASLHNAANAAAGFEDSKINLPAGLMTALQQPVRRG